MALFKIYEIDSLGYAISAIMSDMDAKKAVMLGMTIGTMVGGYLPSFFGVSLFSPISLLGNVAGGLIGIYIAYKLVNG